MKPPTPPSPTGQGCCVGSEKRICIEIILLPGEIEQKHDVFPSPKQYWPAGRVRWDVRGAAGGRMVGSRRGECYCWQMFSATNPIPELAASKYVCLYATTWRANAFMLLSYVAPFTALPFGVTDAER